MISSARALADPSSRLTQKHLDLTGRLIMVDPAGRESLIGALKMTSSDLVTMGSNSAWFTLIDQHGDPLRNHAGENCSVFRELPPRHGTGP